MPRKQRSTGTANANRIPPVPTTTSGILTVEETAGLLRVPKSSVYEWTRYRGINRGTPLPHRRIGKYLRFLRSEVLAWLQTPQSMPTHKRAYRRAA